MGSGVTEGRVARDGIALNIPRRHLVEALCPFKARVVRDTHVQDTRAHFSCTYDVPMTAR